MRRKQTRGCCKYCGKEYTRGGMLRHLATCKQRAGSLEKEKGKTKCGYFQLVLYAKYIKEYWLIIEISEKATLKDLDQFIRDIWVECCGHLSAFEIYGTQYESCPDHSGFWGAPGKDMNYKLKDVLAVGTAIAYEYDFGDTTDLILEIHDYREGWNKKEKVTILSRNHPLEFICGQCGEKAGKFFSPEDYYEGNPFWCEDCLKKAEQDEEEGECCDDFGPEWMLPVCNSPRMGVCGYEGSYLYPDQWEPDIK